jgi:phage I-like protein
VELDGKTPVATVEWTDKGREAIENKRYLFISPTYGPWTDEHGSTTPDVLQGAALTNKPFLNMAPVVNLSRADVFAEEVGRGDEITAPPSDSRAVMPTTSPKILEALGLPEDADEPKVLSAITDLRAEPKSLDAQAKEAGMVLLSQADHDALKGEADKAGALELRVQTLEQSAKDAEFEGAYTKALEAGKVDATDETKGEWRELFDAAPAVTVKRLAALPQVVNTKPQGKGGGDPEIGEAPKGVDPEAYELDQRVKAFMAEHPDTDYLKALDAVQKES